MRGNALFFVMDVFSREYPPDLQTGDSHAKACAVVLWGCAMISAVLRIVLAPCLILMTAGGAWAQPPQAAKTVGLIAAMSDVLTVTTLGKNTITGSERRFSIESWKVSERVAAAVQRHLGKGFKVQRIPAPAGAFITLNNPGFFAPNFDENYGRMVRALAGSQKADFYLAITPGYSRVDRGDLIARGLGVVRSENLLTKKDVVYSLVLYRVFDAQFQMVRSEGAMLGKGSSVDTIVGPNTVLEGGKRLPADARIAAEDGRTKEMTMDLLDKDLAATLPKLFARK